jgi:3-oxoacyl-(acyl-carrier-protein) synthase/3-hydroxymyristoyl/3-hydroxydecanoyl-(acyl carrier protein) dehydratase
MIPDDAIAIVGIGGVFPGALDSEAMWANVCSKSDATATVRNGRWIAGSAGMLASEPSPDKAYSDRCCLVPEFRLDPAGLEIDPGLIGCLDPLHRLTLQAGRESVSGRQAARLNRARTGVILAAIMLPTDGASALTRAVFRPFLETALGRSPAAGAPAEPLTRASAIASRVGGFPAALLARSLGLGGGSYTLDAACASSLYAVKLACDELRAGRADAMLAGGVSRPDCLFTQVGFSQLRALSPSGRCAPFDCRADGLVVGEGAGIVVLKRLEDALRDQDRIWGIVAGAGLSNDLRGNLLSPDSEGQLRAMRAAYESAGWSPAEVDLIECHGAGTPVGDAVELASLRSLWGDSGWKPGQCPIGSIKSMIGHLLTAAGAAGLLKLLMALRHGLFPPTLHFRAPPDGSPLIGGPFRVQTETEPWPRRSDGAPRRAALSAFGFGGINAHLLIEEYGFGLKKPNRMYLKDELLKKARETGGREMVPDTSEVEKTQTGGEYPRSSNQHPGPAPTAVAIVGMSVCVGAAETLAEFGEALAAGRSLIAPRPAERWKGCDTALPADLADLKGAYLREILIGRNEFHIPPIELPDILPQQLLMLKTAAAAMTDAGMPLRADRPSMGALIGVDFDFDATNFHLRWHLEALFPEYRRMRFPLLSPAADEAWLAGLKDAVSPPLTASRTLGALGSMAASRIAREFRLGGISFVVAAQEASGLQALAIAVRALQAGELDAALVGAVDCGGDIRRIALIHAVGADQSQSGCAAAGTTTTGGAPGEGAVALVLKRLEDARRDENRIYAVIRGIGYAGGEDACIRSLDRAGEESGRLPESGGRVAVLGDTTGLEEKALEDWTRRKKVSCDPGSIRDIAGDCGAISGLVSVAAAGLCLHQGLKFPGAEGPPAGPAELGSAIGPPCAVVAAGTSDGNCMHVVLEGGDTPGPLAFQPPQSGAADTRETVEIIHEDLQLRIPIAGRPIRLAAFSPHDSPPPAAPDPGPAAVQHLVDMSGATAAAHAAFLQASADLTRACAEVGRVYGRLAAAMTAKGIVAPGTPGRIPPAFEREHCLEFARGSAAKVLGPEFAAVDGFPARVRLPDEPLMLVDRILEIQGQKGIPGPGRIVTEHDVRAGAWYLDGGRAPVCISVEAGQADLFLCAWLGIDLAVRGRRTYRLLDATVEFHRDLPQPGETIRYVIDIDKFIRQGDTRLFLFRFEATIAEAPFLTMTGGCAGFFTPEEVANSGGIILTDEENAPQPGTRPDDWSDPVPMAPEAYDERAVAALRSGDLEGCFGGLFRGLVLPDGLRLPGGRMALIDRVTELDPRGGRFGLGRIRAEADIHPDDWFLTCHFVDDKVMPGTLMYECCAHALRVFLQRLGWVSLNPQARYAPLTGRPAALRCRGPVTPETRRVIYQVDIKELGYGPQPYAAADADMFADGRPIVRFTDISMQLTPASRDEIEALWAGRRPGPLPEKPLSGAPPGHLPPDPAGSGFRRDEPPLSGPRTTRDQGPEPRPAAEGRDREHLVEFASGMPSRAFGTPYRPFDSERFIARLPAPPFLFIDRITGAEPEPWVVKPGGWVSAELDIDPRAWYIAAEGSGCVPYCVLLEAALQPCGYLAAYMGSALKSDKPLRFRNLGGHGTLRRPVAADAGTLSIRTRMTHVSEVTDMIIEHFDFELLAGSEPVYAGSTYFGFFTRSALDRQEGIRGASAKAFQPEPGNRPRGSGVRFDDEPPLSPADARRRTPAGLVLPSKALRMIDRIDLFLPEGGLNGLGYIRGSKAVDPQEWFFRAHFHQDPVCPGSLGLESFLQLLKFAARERWPGLIATHRFAAAVGRSHRWIYRGQILPENKLIRIEATVTRVTEGPCPALFAEGFLEVDGLVIYRLEDFGIQLAPIEKPSAFSLQPKPLFYGSP